MKEHKCDKMPVNYFIEHDECFGWCLWEDVPIDEECNEILGDISFCPFCGEKLEVD
jgi:hypothetical protein